MEVLYKMNTTFNVYKVNALQINWEEKQKKNWIKNNEVSLKLFFFPFHVLVMP